MYLSQVIQDFHASDEKYLFLTLELEKHENIREIIKNYFKPRMVARTKYKAKIIEIKCEECEEWNNIYLGESEYAGYMALPGDSKIECKKCGERTYFCNEYDSLADYKNWGNLRCLSFKSTKKLVIIKEPFEYPRTEYNESYRKWNQKWSRKRNCSLKLKEQ